MTLLWNLDNIQTGVDYTRVGDPFYVLANLKGIGKSMNYIMMLNSKVKFNKELHNPIISGFTNDFKDVELELNEWITAVRNLLEELENASDDAKQ